MDYPSADDRAAAEAEARDLGRLGGDIMIHGGAASIGCVAIGDQAIEELFWLVATVGYNEVGLIFVPDASPASRITSETPAWLRERYENLGAALRSLGIGSD